MALAHNRYIDQWNKIESPEKNSYTYGYLIFDKGGKNIQWGKDSFFDKWCWEKWTATCKRMKLEHFLIQYTKLNSTWIKDINVRPETIKLLEENIGRTFYDINQSKILYDPLPRVMEIKTKVNKWNLVKLKSFLVSGLTIRSLIHFEFIFVYGIRKCSNFILLHVAVQFSQPHLLKRLSLPHWIFSHPLSKIRYP